MSSNKEQLLSYIIKVLETPNPHFGNFPACPFVKNERLNGRILFEQISFSISPTVDIKNRIHKFHSEAQSYTLLLYDIDSRLPKDEFINYGISLCEIFREERIISIALHPSDDFNINGYYTRGVPFNTLIVQFAEQIIKAQELLINTDYYKYWKETNINNNYYQFDRFLLNN